MTLMSCATIILVFTLPPYILACGGGQLDVDSLIYEYKTLEEENSSIDQLDDLTLNSSGIKYEDALSNNLMHHGWTPSPNELQQWKDWFDNYKSEFNQSIIDFIDPNNLKEFDEERGPGSGWPIRWADAGVGFGGAEPPPWAYAPKNTGKPRYCFLPPRAGVCVPPEGLDLDKYTTPAPSLRFAYHPYKDECIPFAFSGCSGNRNNFDDRQKCEQRCVALVPFNGCDIESHIYIDDVVAVR